MAGIDDEIHGELMRLFTGTPTILTGIVTAVNEADATCSVKLTGTEEVATEDILLGVMLEQTDGLLLIPAIDSLVHVAKADFATPAIIKTGVIDKLSCTIGDNVIYMDAERVKLTRGDVVVELAGTKVHVANGSKNLATVLDNLMTAILALTVGTAMGPSSPPINSATFNTIKADFNNLLT